MKKYFWNLKILKEWPSKTHFSLNTAKVISGSLTAHQEE